MADPSNLKSCSSRAAGPDAGGEAGSGARRRLGKRVAAAKVRVAHDYIDTLNAARRVKHPDKQGRLILELRAEIAALKRVVFRLRNLVAPSDTPLARRPDGAKDHRPPF